MKKILAAGIIVLGTLGLYSCERTDNRDSTALENDTQRIVDRDTIVTEYEVKETIVDYDTTTRTRTVDPKDRDNRNDRDRKRN